MLSGFKTKIGELVGIQNRVWRVGRYSKQGSKICRDSKPKLEDWSGFKTEIVELVGIQHRDWRIGEHSKPGLENWSGFKTGIGELVWILIPKCTLH